jgi:hypothetical protein
LSPTEHIAKLIRLLEREGLPGKPLSSSMIAANPCTLLTSDDRPHRRGRRQDRVVRLI